MVQRSRSGSVVPTDLANIHGLPKILSTSRAALGDRLMQSSKLLGGRARKDS